MKPPYPQFYLDGNIELQAAVDSYRTFTHRACLKWLAFTCASFLSLLAGVTFEIPLLTFLGITEATICASTLHMLLSLEGDYL